MFEERKFYYYNGYWVNVLLNNGKVVSKNDYLSNQDINKYMSSQPNKFYVDVEKIEFKYFVYCTKYGDTGTVKDKNNLWEALELTEQLNRFYNLDDDSIIHLCLDITSEWIPKVEKGLEEYSEEELFSMLIESFFKVDDLEGLYGNLDWVIENIKYKPKIVGTSFEDFLGEYKTYSYIYMNSFLRESKEPFDIDRVYDSIKKFNITIEENLSKEDQIMKILKIATEEMNRVLLMAPKLKADLYVYRGSTAEGILSNPLNTFCSTSLNRKVAIMFTGGPSGHLYKINIPKGFPCFLCELLGSSYYREIEIILPYGTYISEPYKLAKSKIEVISVKNFFVYNNKIRPVPVIHGSLILRVPSKETDERQSTKSDSTLIKYSIPLLVVAPYVVSKLYKWYKKKVVPHSSTAISTSKEPVFTKKQNSFEKKKPSKEPVYTKKQNLYRPHLKKRKA